MPSLRVLDMRQMRGLTVASIDTLLAAQHLEKLDVRHCESVTAAAPSGPTIVVLDEASARLRLLPIRSRG
jgi:hypothetical protein